MLETHEIDIPYFSFKGLALGLPLFMALLILMCFYVSQCACYRARKEVDLDYHEPIIISSDGSGREDVDSKQLMITPSDESGD
ncbi:unnamed protein product, partial [Mesorhabditis spiculigera]